MEVQFTLEQQAQLALIAKRAGTAPEDLVTSLVTRYLGEEARFLAAVDKGLAAADRGEFIEEEEMNERLVASGLLKATSAKGSSITNPETL